MGGISLPLALLGVQAMLGVVVVDAQYNVYYGYTAQELQEFISDTVMPIVSFNSLQCFHPRRQAWWWRRWFMMVPTATAGRASRTVCEKNSLQGSGDNSSTIFLFFVIV